MTRCETPSHSRSVPRCACRGPGFRVQGPGSGVRGPGFRVQGSGSRVQGPGSRAVPAGSPRAVLLLCRAWRCRMRALELRVHGHVHPSPPPKVGRNTVTRRSCYRYRNGADSLLPPVTGSSQGLFSVCLASGNQRNYAQPCPHPSSVTSSVLAAFSSEPSALGGFDRSQTISARLSHSLSPSFSLSGGPERLKPREHASSTPGI